MNAILFFVVFTVACFLVTFVAIGLFRKDAMFTLAIGAVIGANIYNVGNFPINIGPFIFGMDSIVYTIFAFCVLYMFMDYGKKSMFTVLYTALFSIFFSALLAAFGAYLNNGGITSAQVWTSLSYIFSIIATYVTVLCMSALYNKMEHRNANKFITIFLCLVVADVTNSIIYFGLSDLFAGTFGSIFGLSLAGSVIGKFIAIMLCVLLYYLLTRVWKQKNNKQKPFKYVNANKKLK